MASKKPFISIQYIAVIFIVITITIAGIWYITLPTTEPDPASFSMEVYSRPYIPMKGDYDVPMCIPRQKVVLLVIVKDTGEGVGYGEAVEVSATTTNAEISVDNPVIKPGEVAEVNVLPDLSSINKILTITINGVRSGINQNVTIDLEVIDWEDDLGEVASEMRDKFIPWLATNHHEFDITSETEWTGTIVNPRNLVVMHYMFYSENWEIYLTWHVMIPPYDWTRMYLRSRFTDVQSSYAFEISSIQGGEQPHSIELPDWV